MKRWTWLAIAATTGACSFPTSEFNLGGAADVPVVDTGAVDTGAVDVPAVTDLGGLDAGADVVDAGGGDDAAGDAAGDAGADAGGGDDAASDAASDAGDDAGTDAGTDAGAGDAAGGDDVGCPAGRVMCGAACVDLLNDDANCGRCNFACNGTNGSATCVAGRCEVTCRAGFADCDADPRNGCEVGLNTITNCRACGDVCPAGATLNGTPACVANVCRTNCAAGFGDCDGNAANGCEAPLSSPTNCGMCGRACPSGQSCAGGACTVNCNAPNITCGSACVDPQTSSSNCGACNVACPNPPNAVGACRAGACAIGSCATGFADCNGMPADGCETRIDTITNCGACGRMCAFSNGVAACTAGACVMTGCSARNFADCDMSSANGCERDTGTDPTNCGACGTVCRSHVGSGTPCAAGACTPTCNPGYGNCDRNNNNGCESSLNTNDNCGACGRVCAAGMACRSGLCTLVSGSAATYARSNLVTTFVDACAVPGSTRLLPSVDDNAVLVPLPFAFAFWGTALPAGSMINVSSNGLISLDGAVNNSLQGLIPDTAAPNGVIAAWWTDLVTSATGICTVVTGAAPTRRFLVQWSSITYYGNRTADMNFEVALNESGSTIDLVYQRLAPLPPGYVPTVGIENALGNAGDFICSTANATCAIASGNAFRYVPR